jgi:protein-S-isoprenylcysteine O-methyltransferase Ste14
MTLTLWIALLAGWVIWFYPFIFRAPHWQKRQSIIARGPTAAGLALEVLAIGIALSIRLPDDVPRSSVRFAVAIIAAPLSWAIGWMAVTHLGKQFRVTAGLWEDHELVTTGPYGVVRHPIYTSLLTMMVCTMALVTPLPWAAACLAIYIVGTEIRVRTEDALLHSRFGDKFLKYQKSVSAYIPFVR